VLAGACHAMEGEGEKEGGAGVVAGPWCRDGSGRWGAGDVVRCS
jgi:hypothetical protein